MPEVKPGPTKRKKDTRPSNVQFAQKGGHRVRMLLDSFERLGKFGTARGSKPNAAQVAWCEKTLSQALDLTLANLRRALSSPDSPEEKSGIEVPLE